MLWYHVSDEFIGYQATFMPRQNKGEAFILHFEGNVPRICVSNNIYFCIRSKIGREDLRVYDLMYQFRIREFFDEEEPEGGDNLSWICRDDGKLIVVKNPSIYITEQSPYYPPNHSDFRRNNEMWFTTPTQFQFIGFLSIDQMIKNHVVRFTNQQIEQIWIPVEIERDPLNPYMDCLYNNNQFFYDKTSFRRDVEQGIVPLYVHDYAYPKDEKEVENILKNLGVLK